MFQNLFMCLHLFYKFSEDQLFKYILRKKKTYVDILGGPH